MVWSHLKDFCLAKMNLQCTVKGNKGEVGRIVGKTILKSGQEWTLPSLPGQPKTGQGGNGSSAVPLQHCKVLG